LFKFFDFQDRMNILNKTLANALEDLLHFFILFFLIFLSYAALALLLFGPHILPYSSVGRVIQSLGEIMLGNFDFGIIFEINPLMSSLLFWTYVILVCITLVNIFLAILIDAYAEAKNASQDALGIHDDFIALLRRMRAYGLAKQPKLKGQQDPLLQALRFFEEQQIKWVSVPDLMWAASAKGAKGKKGLRRVERLLQALPGKSIAMQAELELQDMLQANWVKFDKDKSGYLDEQEFMAFLRETPVKMTDEEMLDLMKMADKSGDGLIQFDEFASAFHALMFNQVVDRDDDEEDKHIL